MVDHPEINMYTAILTAAPAPPVPEEGARMPIVKSSLAPLFELPALSVRGLAAPSRGARETCVWQITLAPGTPGTPHSVDREEIFVALGGEAQIAIDGASPVALGAGAA